MVLPRGITLVNLLPRSLALLRKVHQLSQLLSLMPDVVRIQRHDDLSRSRHSILKSEKQNPIGQW